MTPVAAADHEARIVETHQDPTRRVSVCIVHGHAGRHTLACATDAAVLAAFVKEMT